MVDLARGAERRAAWGRRKGAGPLKLSRVRRNGAPGAAAAAVAAAWDRSRPLAPLIRPDSSPSAVEAGAAEAVEADKA